MGSRAPFGIGEWYHCYNRGVDKRLIFTNGYDYERFLLHTYVGNGARKIAISELNTTNLEEILRWNNFDKGEPLVEIGAYALMPNHFHFILQEIAEGGISSFMQRVCTGYTMYFNNRRERTGALLAGTYRSKHLADDQYLKHAVSYVLLNPAELFEPRWKDGVGDIKMLADRLLEYRYSSLPDFFEHKRPLNKIVGRSLSEYYDKAPTLSKMLQEAQLYYQELQV